MVTVQNGPQVHAYVCSQIADLQKEKADDVKMKDFCIEALHKNEVAIEMKARDIEQLSEDQKLQVQLAVREGGCGRLHDTTGAAARHGGGRDLPRLGGGHARRAADARCVAPSRDFAKIFLQDSTACNRM